MARLDTFPVFSLAQSGQLDLRICGYWFVHFPVRTFAGLVLKNYQGGIFLDNIVTILDYDDRRVGFADTLDNEMGMEVENDALLPFSRDLSSMKKSTH